MAIKNYKADTSLPLRRKSNWVVSIEAAFRLTVFFLVLFMFIPALNPARISEKVNRNISLFTSGFFYPSLVANMGRIISKGWIQEATMLLAFFSSMAACLGIMICGTGACLSLGNGKLKRIAYLSGAGGGVLVCLSAIGLSMARDQIFSTTDMDKARPLDPQGLKVLLIFGAVVLVFSVLNLLFGATSKKDDAYHMAPPMQLFLMLLPFLVLAFLFNYLPLWGWRFAFFDYQPGEELAWDRFVGFKWFTFLFENDATVKDILRVMKNTLAMSGLGILTSWCPMAFAIFLSEIRNTWIRRVIQTLTTIPNFISWVLVYAIAFCIFSTDGFLSSMMVNSGVWDSGKNLLMGEDHIWLKMLGWGMWKGLGWSAIMYIAAITAIDPQLYEAARVDGAGRFQRMWYITVPELIPTYMVLLLLAIAGILNNGMEQYLVFENATNTQPIQVLDLYVYKLGIGKGLIPVSTLIGMVKSIISVALLFGANMVSKLVRGKTIV